MSQISKCPNITVILTYWEPLGEVSELRYKSLLYSSSKRSYCSDHLKGIPLKSEITFCVKQECTEKAVVFSVTTNLADPVITILRIQKINKSNKS